MHSRTILIEKRQQIQYMFYPSLVRELIFVMCLVGLALYAWFGGYFAQDIVVEIAILAILAMSLDVIAGFGAMISLCHGAIMGVAAYIYAVMMIFLGWSPAVAACFALVGAGVCGLCIGWITAKVSGIFFLMATLAFGQMAYTIIYKSRWLGGTDGLGGFDRFSSDWIAMHNPLIFAFYALFVVAIVYFLAFGVLRSSFGRSLVGMRVNETRMQALGVDTWRVRTIAFGFSAIFAAFAGVLSAQHTLYITPQLLDWVHSGEIVIVMILGGIGTLVGGILGAIVFVALKHGFATYTDHWHMYIGLVLILSVIGKPKGLYQYCEKYAMRLMSQATKK